MNMHLLIAATIAALPTAALADPTPIGKEARIASATSLHIRDFRADGRNILYIQDRARNWYRASFVTPCRQLPFARSIAVDTSRQRSLDRFSTLIVGGNRCQLNSFVRVAGPPKKVRGPVATRGQAYGRDPHPGLEPDVLFGGFHIPNR